MSKILIFLIAAYCACQSSAGYTVNSLYGYKSALVKFLDINLKDNTDVRVDLDLIPKWKLTLTSDTYLSSEVMRAHEAMVSARKVIDNPTCKPEEWSLLKTLVEMRTSNSYYNFDRVCTAIKAVEEEHFKKCHSVFASHATRFLNELTPLDHLSLLSIARKLESWSDNIVESVHDAILAHVDDPLVSSASPRVKSPPLTLKQFDSIYDKYVSEPCGRFMAQKGGLKAYLDLYPKYNVARIAPMTSLILNACKKISSNQYGVVVRGKEQKRDLREAVKQRIEGATGFKISRSLFEGR